MIYLIGGAPRVGKTKLIKTVLAAHPMHAVATDAIRHMLRTMLPNDQLHHDLRFSAVPDPDHRNPAEILDNQNRESIALWPYLVKLMENHIEDGQDLLVEGVAVTPELVALLPFETRSIVLVNTDPSHADTIIEHAHQTPNDWLHAYSEQQIVHYATFFAYMSDYLRAEAAKHSIPYVELHDKTFESDIQRAARLLLGGS